MKQGLGFFIFYLMDPDLVDMDPLKIATYFTMSKKKSICIPIMFDNPLKVYFFNKKYLITIQTRLTQIAKVYFLLNNQFLTDF